MCPAYSQLPLSSHKNPRIWAPSCHSHLFPSSVPPSPLHFNPCRPTPLHPCPCCPLPNRPDRLVQVLGTRSPWPLALCLGSGANGTSSGKLCKSITWQSLLQPPSSSLIFLHPAACSCCPSVLLQCNLQEAGTSGSALSLHLSSALNTAGTPSIFLK